MRKKNSIKCGEYWMKDGVVIKRPGKSFRVPSMPSKYKTPRPEYDPTATLVFFGTIDAHDDMCEKIEEMNALKEINWQNDIKRKHTVLETLYYIGQARSMARKIVRRAKRGFSRLIKAVVREYDF